MAKQSASENPLIDIDKPTMTSPVAGGIYRSPIVVRGMADVGTGLGTADYEASFYEPYESKKDWIPADKRIAFEQNLVPGPKRLDIRTGYRIASDQSWSEWLAIGWFYVLTPPVD